MDFYVRKSLACNDISSMLQQHKPLPEIRLFILEKYGLSEKFVNNYLRSCENAGVIKVDGGVYEIVKN